MATIETLRALALAMPEAEERTGYGEPDFHFRGKSFALQWKGVVIMKLDRAHQDFLFEVRSETFRPYKVATVHWSQVEIAHLGDEELGALVREAWSTVAPKRMAAILVRA